MELDKTKQSSQCNTVSDFSLKNVKFNLKYDDLKGNLSPQKQLKSKVSSFYKELINAVEGKRMMKFKIRKDEKSVDKLVHKAYSLRKQHFSLKKISKNYKEKKRSQETNLTDFNINLTEVILEEKSIKDKLNKTIELRAKSEEKTMTIANYCKETKIKSENLNEYVYINN